MKAFPAYFPLDGARVVIAGVGEPAEARTRLFADSPAEVVRLDEIWGLDPDAYQGASLIFVASHDDVFARQAEVAARTAGAPLNVFDRPQLSDFNTPAIIDRGSVVVGVGTSGAAPLLAQSLRAELETRLPAGIGETADLLGARRAEIRAAFPDLADRRSFLRTVLANSALTAASLDEALARRRPPEGRISLIELPAAVDLVSLRAIQALAAAEVVAAPPVGEGLLARHARRDAVRLVFEDLSPEPLVDFARQGRGVAVVGPPLGLAESLAGAQVSILRAAPEAA